MSDLMNENMGHDSTQCFMMIGPIVDDRPAVEKHHVGKLSRPASDLLRESHALEQAQEFERILDAESVENIVGCQVLDPDHHIRRQRLEFIRQPVEGTAGERIDLCDRRRFELRPVGREGSRHAV